MQKNAIKSSAIISGYSAIISGRSVPPQAEVAGHGHKRCAPPAFHWGRVICQAVTIAILVTRSTAADTWDRGAGTGFWSTGTNWADNTEPTSADPVIFPTPIPGGVATVTLSSGEQAQSITFNDNYLLSSGNVQLFGVDGLISVASGRTATINSSIIGSNGLLKSGSGTLVLSPTGNNTFTGGVDIIGTLSITKDTSLGNAANAVVIGPGITSGAVLQTTLSMTTSRTISPGIFGGTIRANSGTQFTINGALGGLSNPLTIDGAGTVVLGNNSTRSGSTTIQNGTVRLNQAAGLGTGGATVSNNGVFEIAPSLTTNTFISLGNNGTVRTGGAGAVHGGSISVQAGALAMFNSGTLSTHTLALGDVDGGSGSTAAVIGSGTVSLTGANSFTGQWLVSGGTLRLAHVDAVSTSTSPFTVGTSATLIAETASNYAGDWNSSGLVRLQHASGLGIGASAFAVNNNATLQIEGVDLARNLTLNGGGTIRGTGNATASGVVTVADAVPIVHLASGAASTDTLTLNQYTGGTGSVTRVSGSGEVILVNPNAYFGTWEILGGALRMENPLALGGNLSPVVIGNGGTLHIKSDPIDHDVLMNNGSTLKGSMTGGGFQPQMQGTVSIASGAQVTLATPSNADILQVGGGTNTLTGGGGGSTITVAPNSNVALLSPSDYSGTWVVPGSGPDDATLQISDDNQLGNPANGVTLAGGVFRPGGSVTTSRVFTNAGFSSIAPLGTLTMNSGLAGAGPAAAFLAFDGGTTVLNAPATWLGTTAFIQGFGKVVMNDAAALGNSTIQPFDGTLHVGDGITVSQPMTMNGVSTVSGGINSTYAGTINANGFTNRLSAPLASDTLTISNLTGGGVGKNATILGNGTVTLAGANNFTGSYVVNSGTLRLTHANAVSTAVSPIEINSGGAVEAAVASNYAGDWQLNGGTLRVQQNDGLGTGTSTVQVGGGSRIQLDGVFLDRPVQLNDGGTLAATATSIYSESGWPKVSNAASDVFIDVSNPADRLTIGSAIRSSLPAPTIATIHVNGAGRIVLDSGGTSAGDIFAGSWEQSGGILQVGQHTSPNNAINALGFKNGDARQANSITVNGGTLAVGHLGSGPNTPAWLRANVTLAGGAIASASTADAQYGGDFSVAAGTTSKVLVFDPTNPNVDKNVGLVAGAAGVDNNAAATTWGADSTLIVDPGTTAGGIFTIQRSGGTISVGSNATLQIDPGASVSLGGAADALSDGNNHVNVDNNSTSTLGILEGNKNIGSLSGVGNTFITGGASLTVHQNDDTGHGAISGSGALIKEGSGILTVGSLAVGALTVNGGAISPGSPIGTATIDGTYTQSSGGTLHIDLSSPVSFDQLVVTGNALIDGTLDVSLVNGFTPSLGDTFGFLTANGGFGGAFASLNLPDLSGLSLDWLLNPVGSTLVLEVVAAAQLPGDLDGDGFVGITDLNIVLGNWNQTVPPADARADPSGDNFVGINDLNTVLGNWNAGTPPSCCLAAAYLRRRQDAVAHKPAGT
jgi:autotransporter-associated beta strand protein